MSNNLSIAGSTACTSSSDISPELDRLRRENEALRATLAKKCGYIRSKTNELLEIMGTKSLRPEELDDETLVDLDPLGIIAGSIRHILDNLKEKNRQLHIVNEETTAIFETAEVGILVIDPHKRLQACNNKLKELFFPLKEIAEVTGKLCRDEVCRNRFPDEGCACEMILGGMDIAKISSWEFDNRIFRVIARPIRDRSGEIEDIVVVYNEITELKRAEEQLSRSNFDLEVKIRERTRQLELANKELESFCYSVSHDLRAPLRHISGFASILSEECSGLLDEIGQDCLKRILKSSSHMGKLIDELLRLSRVSQTEIILTDVDLTLCAERIVAMYRDTEPGRNVRTVIADGLVARCDAVLMEMVLQNLIGNAWKYSAEKPEALIEFGSITEDGEKRYFVRDNGVGFDMAYRKKLFQVFERLHGSQFEGTGVGLATVHRIIARHGGRIWADAEVGKGATFFFTLPD